MAKVIVKSKTKKIKRKFPVEIKAPEFLGSVSLGKSQVTDLNKLEGKTAKINLMYITGNLKNQNVRLTFKIVEVNSGLAKTIVSKYEQIPYYLTRLLKKGVDLVEDVIDVESKDNVKFRVKNFIITKSKSSEEVLRSLRLKAKELIIKEGKMKKYDEFLSQVINGRLQIQLRNELKGIYPIKFYEFKKIELKK